MDQQSTGPSVGDTLELVTGPVAAGGGCVARTDQGQVVFVRHALPGERVTAVVREVTRSYLRADAVAVGEAAEGRVEPLCAYAGPGRCGGCDWQHVDLSVQRAWKATLITEQLARLAGLDRQVVVEALPMPGSGDGAVGVDDGLGWRTRVRFAVDADGRAGFRHHRSHQVEPVERCLIAAPGVEAVGVEARRWPGADEVDVFVGSLNGPAVVRVSGTTTEMDDGPDGEPTGDEVEVEPGAPRSKAGKNRRRPVRSRVQAQVLGRRFSISPGVFWQVHPSAPEVLARAVLEGLSPRPGERAVDLYAGAGLFSALLGEAVGPEGSVLAVERDRRACRDCTANVAGLPAVSVRTASVTASLVASGMGTPDLVVLDPAREGAGTAVMAALAGLNPAPRAVASVSCDPATFARDLRVLLDAGWQLQSLRAFDLFPMTEHVELVAICRPPRA